MLRQSWHFSPILSTDKISYQVFFPEPNTGKSCKISLQEPANGPAYWLADPLCRDPNTPCDQLMVAFQWDC